VRLPATWDAYLATLERSHRYVVSRSLRELKAWAGASGYELRRATTPEQLAEGRAVLERLHEQRWNDRGRAGVFASERFARFHDRVMPRLLEGTDGQLELWWLVVAGEPVAAAYNISYRGRVYFYQSGRKLDVPKSAKPGVALHALLLQEAIARGIQEYDFLQGESMYKRQLAPDSRSLITLRAASPALRARLVHSAAALTERGVRMARQKLGPRRPRAQVEAS
jgi:CelD/BcsL family acetyltransferase involved in cellulose biosynthesis